MQILNDLRKAYRACDDPLFDACEARLREILDCAESAAVTAVGNTTGLTEQDQLEALRASVVAMADAMDGSGDKCETCDGSGRVLDHNKWSVDEGKWKRSFDEEISVECPNCDEVTCS
jgi:hypothetical protein